MVHGYEKDVVVGCQPDEAKPNEMPFFEVEGRVEVLAYEAERRT